MSQRRFTLVTLFTPNYREFGIVTEGTKRRYCQKHHYGFVPFRDAFDDRPAAWSKIKALLAAFDSHPSDWYFWLDADALIANDEVTLEELVDTNCDLVATKDTNGLNSGSFLLRRSQRSKDFLLKAFDRIEFLYHQWWEQAAMVATLEEEKNDIRVHYHPQRVMNSYGGGPIEGLYHDGDFVLHLAATPIRERQARVNQAILGHEFRHRADLPSILNARFEKPVGCEIGVGEGEHAEFLLKNVRFQKFYCIDPWQYISGRKDWSNVSNEMQENVYRDAQERLSKFGEVTQIVRHFSITAASRFQNGYFDFIYIDADHSYEACRADLHAYYPKLKKGGILAGHDYLNGDFDEGVFGVKQAVDEFVDEQKCEYFFVGCEPWPSWLLIKRA